MSTSRRPHARLLWLTLMALAAGVARFSVSAQGQGAGAQGAPPPGGPAVPGAPFGGRGRGGDPAAADFSPKPPYLPRTPAEEARGFMLPAGYRMELVASDPDIINPTVLEFDGNGRMYVGEMVGYMMDADAKREHDPVSRISRWGSSK